MFDYLKIIHRCPNCGRGLNRYQAKGIPRLLGYPFDGYGDSYRFEELLDEKFREGTFEVYDLCFGCRTHIEGNVTIEEKLIRLNELRYGKESLVIELKRKV